MTWVYIWARQKLKNFLKMDRMIDLRMVYPLCKGGVQLWKMRWVLVRKSYCSVYLSSSCILHLPSNSMENWPLSLASMCVCFFFNLIYFSHIFLLINIFLNIVWSTLRLRVELLLVMEIVCCWIWHEDEYWLTLLIITFFTLVSVDLRAETHAWFIAEKGKKEMVEVHFSYF